MKKKCVVEEKMDYSEYQFKLQDWLEYVSRLLVKGILICYLFYDSFRALVLLIPLGIFDYRVMKKKKKYEQKKELTLQFKEMIEALGTALSAGYSLERSFEEAKKDLCLVYSSEAFIFRELDGILEGLRMNVPLEQHLTDFGRRSGVEDITNFANVVMVAKRSGGNLVKIIQKTVNSISDKLAVEEEIDTLITAKKYEERIMMVMPYAIILYLRLTSGEFFDVLYHNVLGILLMSLFLVLIHIADLWAQRIMEIEV